MPIDRPIQEHSARHPTGPLFLADLWLGAWCSMGIGSSDAVSHPLNTLGTPHRANTQEQPSVATVWRSADS